MKNSILATGLVGCIVLLYFWLFAPLPQATGRPIDQLPNSPSIPSNAFHSLSSTDATTFTFYLPIIARAPELYGYVTENGQPISNISVTLFTRFPHPYAVSEVGTTKTDANGLYNFTGVPSIACEPTSYPYCWQYYIQYDDSAPPPDRLVFWETGIITNYMQGTAQPFPTFDISAPVLLFPGAGDVVSPTLTFTWIPRSLPTDNYQLEIWEPSHSWPSIYISDLGYTNAYAATFVGDNCGGPCANLYNRPLQWRLSLRESGMQGHGYMKFSGVFTITTP
jgi:hypothetical protein